MFKKLNVRQLKSGKDAKTISNRKEIVVFLHKRLFVKKHKAKVYHENPWFQIIMEVRHAN